ncbi:MAG TPA: cyclopropane-fatty-acyl-phospholipid synthase family protein [Polyangiaceae bacterium]
MSDLGIATEAPSKLHPPGRAAERNEERGRSHGLSLIFWLMEQRLWTLLAIPTSLAAASTWATQGGAVTFVSCWFAVPLLGVVLPLLYLVLLSWRHDSGPADWSDALEFRDPSVQRRFHGKKIPMATVYEAYISGGLQLKVELQHLLLRRNELFRFCFTWSDVKFYFATFLSQNLKHDMRADNEDVQPVYDRGNDFYSWFLGESMVYTSGLFRHESESLEVAQTRKLEIICQSLQMAPGDRHLDIGCGWGALLCHAAREHGTQSFGVTLASEQALHARALAAQLGVADKVQVEVRDYRTLGGQRFDKITCVEMAEHVGIKNFQSFLRGVHELLEDDGSFYLQIAGLRRAWQFEDFVWGLFMAKYIFPGADASCPLAFVVGQAERAGFEVHRVENCGAHYAVTIEKWYQNWRRNERQIVERYGQRWFRLWSFFLAWWVLIGSQGSSALFMITMTKNLKNDRETVPQTSNFRFSRRRRFIGPRTIATQQ